MDDMLDKFLVRIGIDPQANHLSATLETLRMLTSAMTATVPFEQLDVALGRGVDPSVDAVFKKIVIHQRGGYCFENNTLMNAALGWLGFDVRRSLARVLVGPRPSGYTHMVNVVRIANADFLVDVGFGADSLRVPLAIKSLDEGQQVILGTGPARRVGAAVLAYPDAYRLVEDCGDSALFPGAVRLQSFRSMSWAEAGFPDVNSINGQSFWKDLYAFHPEQPVDDSDVIVGSYYVSTKLQDNWFTNTRLAVLLTPDGRKILQANTLTRERRVALNDLCALFPETSFEDAAAEAGGDAGEHSCPRLRTYETISSERWLDTLKEEFNVDLTWDYQTDESVHVSLSNFFPNALASNTQMF